jgi:hypothetical protein
MSFQEQTAKDAMDAKGAKDNLGQHLLPSGRVLLVNCPGTCRGMRHPESRSQEPLLGLLRLGLSLREQSFAALASFASLAVCSCR